MLHSCRIALAIVLALGLAFLPLGCGGSENYSYSPIHPTHDGQEVPEDVVARLTECAKQAPAGLKSTKGEPSMYAIQLNVHLGRGGGVDSVDVKDSTLGGGDIESCMARAFQGMSLPMRGMATEVTPQSRALIGNPALLLPATVSMVPVMIAGIGIIVIVAVVLYVSTDKGDDEARRCKGVKETCIEKCSDEKLPTRNFGMDFFNCKNDCLEAHNCPRDS